MMSMHENEKHHKWDCKETDQIYRYGGYAAIRGIYKDDHSSHKQLGVRWTGECDTINFPYHKGGNAWFVEPDFVAHSMLHARREDTLVNPGERGYVDKILAAIKEVAKHVHSTNQS